MGHGVKVFGGIERQSKECYFQIFDDRSVQTLTIQKYIKLGGWNCDSF